MIATREQPRLDLQSEIECRSCWVGQSTVSHITVKNLGGNAGFWVLPESEKDNAIAFKPNDYEQPTEIKISPFSIFPSKFYLLKGESVTLEIKFDPSNEGKSSQQFILGCDNLRVYPYSLSAESNMIELKPRKLNGCDIKPEHPPISSIEFRNIEFNNEITKAIVIENLTKNKVTYEWKLYDHQSNPFLTSRFCDRPDPRGVYRKGEQTVQLHLRREEPDRQLQQGRACHQEHPAGVRQEPSETHRGID